MRRLTQDDYVARASVVHEGRYDYSMIDYQGGKVKIDVKCPTHGVFSVTPENHLGRKSGCPSCHRTKTTVGNLSGTYWGSIISGATKRGIPITITQQNAWDRYVEQDGKCKYTGWDISMSTSGHNQTASLDRIDPSKPYEVGNIQWVHRQVNFSKHTLSEDDFLKLCAAVVDHDARYGQVSS